MFVLTPPGAEGAERQAEEVSEEGKFLVVHFSATFLNLKARDERKTTLNACRLSLQCVFQVGIQMEKEREVAKQLLKDGKKE